jgi:ketosteroid isomerase-like protein
MTTLGDAVPERLATYYTALDNGRFDDAANSFSSDVRYAVPRRGAHEVDPRNDVEGRSALRALFEERGVQPRRHEVLLCVSDGASCLVEGVVRDAPTGEASATFTASLQLDGTGLIERYLAYMCTPAVAPGPRVEAPAGASVDAAEVLHRYFAALDRGAFVEAVHCFSHDVLYSHPPYRHTGITSNRRVEFRGHHELLAAFEARGKRSFTHRIEVCLQRGPNCLLEGVVEDLPGGGTGGFISSLSLDDDGRIARYVSFYCEPGVPRRGRPSTRRVADDATTSRYR